MAPITSRAQCSHVPDDEKCSARAEQTAKNFHGQTAKNFHELPVEYLELVRILWRSRYRVAGYLQTNLFGYEIVRGKLPYLSLCF